MRSKLWFFAGILSFSTFAEAVTPDSLPPEGRSLFDHLAVVKKPDGSFDYDLPTKFSQLIRTLIERARGQIAGFDGASPLGLLLPAGRSLQRADSDLKDPRRVVAFPNHHAPADEWGFSLRDRLFVGHSARKHQLEVISFNELAGRFEFQIVTDYGEGLTPKVRYVDRPTCVRCHRAEAPIFAPRDWDDTNANPVAATGIAWANNLTTTGPDGSVTPNPGASLDDGLSPIVTAVDRAWEFNRSVIRGAEWQFVQKVWQKGCRMAAPLPDYPGYAATDCRAQLAIMAIANRLEVSFGDLVVPPGAAGVQFLPVARLKSLIGANFPDQSLQFPIFTIPPRNLYHDFQLPLNSSRMDQLKRFVSADALTGDHIPDVSIAPDAPEHVPMDDLAADSDRVVSGIRRLWTNFRDMFTEAQWTGIDAKLPQRNDPGIAPALMELYVKIRGNEAFADRPLRRGVVLSAVMGGLGLQTAATTVGCCSRGESFPPVLFTDNTVVQPGLGAERQILRNRCASCHAAAGSDLSFMLNETQLSDRELVIQILSRELKKAATPGGFRLEFCRRLNWMLPTADLGVNSRMPQMPALRLDILAKEKADPDRSERKALLDAARRALLRASKDDGWLNDLYTGFQRMNNPLRALPAAQFKQQLQAYAQGTDCAYTPFTGTTP